MQKYVVRDYFQATKLVVSQFQQVSLDKGIRMRFQEKVVIVWQSLCG